MIRNDALTCIDLTGLGTVKGFLGIYKNACLSQVGAQALEAPVAPTKTAPQHARPVPETRLNLRHQTSGEPRLFGKEEGMERTADLRIDVMNAMDHLINEECTFYDVQVAPDRIRAALHDALELDQAEGNELVRWVARYFPSIADEFEAPER